MTSRYERHISPTASGGGPPPPPVDGGVRDAHVIVVAQDGYLATLASQGSPPLPANDLNLDGTTGDQASLTCDYLDTGNGAQLALALAAALGAGVPIDIRLRPMSLTLGSGVVGTTGLAVPAGCRLIGAGQDISSLTGATAAAATQCVLTLGAAACVEDLTVISPEPAGAPGGTQRGVITGGAGARVRRSRVSLLSGKTFDRVQVVGISLPTPNGTEVVEDVDMEVDSLFDQNTPAVSTAIEVGSASAAVQTDYDVLISNVRVTEAALFVGSAAIAVAFLNTEGGVVENVRHVMVRRPSTLGAMQWSWSLTSVGAITAMIRAAEFSHCLVEALDDEEGSIGASHIGFAIQVTGSPNLTGGVWGGGFDNCTVRFLRNALPSSTINKVGFVVRCITTDVSNINSVSVSMAKAFQASRGLLIDTAGGAGFVRGTSVMALEAPACQTGYQLPPSGAFIRGGVGGGGVSETRLVGCNVTGVNDASGFGIRIQDAACVNTIVGLCNATPIAGTAISDLGTGSQIGLNIVV